jgi:hypothetical protein
VFGLTVPLSLLGRADEVIRLPHARRLLRCMSLLACVMLFIGVEWAHAQTVDEGRSIHRGQQTVVTAAKSTLDPAPHAGFYQLRDELRYHCGRMPGVAASATRQSSRGPGRPWAAARIPMLSRSAVSTAQVSSWLHAHLHPAALIASSGRAFIAPNPDGCRGLAQIGLKPFFNVPPHLSSD